MELLEEEPWTPPANAAPEIALHDFVRGAWRVLEPAVPFVDGWHIDMLCEHLEAISTNRLPESNLLINEPPGSSKSLICSVFWPAWEWTWAPWTRWLTTSYDVVLALRDAVRTRTLMRSDWYLRRISEPWGFTSDQNVKGYYLNDRTGWRIATSVNGGITSHHAHRVLTDDPHSVTKAESDAVRDSTLTTLRETYPSRVLPGGVRVMIGQRVHEEDATADWLEREGKQIHHIELMEERELPKPGEPEPVCSLSGRPHDIRTIEGELLTPERYPAEKIDLRKVELGPYAYSCTPAESPILMADMTLKPVSEVEVGDEVYGFDPTGGNAKSRLRKATVERVFRYANAPVQRLHMASGREVRCTAEHRWYTARSGADGYHPTYQAAHIGSTLMRACEVEFPALTPREQRLGGWLGGFFDGEGSFVGQTISFSQGAVTNAAICDRLEATLDELGLPWSKQLQPSTPAHPDWQARNWYWLRGGIQTLQRFLHVAQPTKWRERMGEAYVGNARWIVDRDKVVAIEDDGEEDVFALETSTGNYIAWGYASSNSQYQQRPTPRAGMVLDVAWFAQTPTLDRAQIDLIMAFDLNYSDVETSDWTVGVLAAVERDHILPRIHIVDVFREHLASSRHDQALADWILLWRPIIVGIEKRAFEKQGATRDLIRRITVFLDEKNFACNIEPLEADADKVTRAQIIPGRAKAGLVTVDRRAKWWPIMSREMSLFPKSQHDDIVDALAYVVRLAVEKLEKVRGKMQLMGQHAEIERTEAGGRIPDYELAAMAGMR